MTEHSPRKLLRRLAAADGYLDLGMPTQALAELDCVGNFEPLEAPVQFLRGKALKAQERYEDAIIPLERAARLIPPPFSGPIWQMLSECLRHEGHDQQAEVAETFAQNAIPEGGQMPVITIQITLKGVADRRLSTPSEEAEPDLYDEELDAEQDPTEE